MQPGSSVAIVGAGPVGLAALMTAKLYSPSRIVVVDKDANRLQVALKLVATDVANPEELDVEQAVMGLTEKVGCDTVIEAVGVPATFELAQDLVAPGGTIANVGVHGTSARLKLEKLWSHNICKYSVREILDPADACLLAITTRLIDTVTTPLLLRLFAAGSITANELITHGKWPKFLGIRAGANSFRRISIQ